MYQWIRNISLLYDFKAFAQSTGRYPSLEGLVGKKSQSILCYKNKILKIGSDRSIQSHIKSLGVAQLKRVRETDAQKMNVYPGFVECHTHLTFAGNRAAEFEKKLNGVSYQQIAQEGGGILSTVSHTRRTSDRDLKLKAEERLRRFKRQGVVIAEAKSGYALDRKNEIRILELQKELKELPVVSTFLGAHALPPEHTDAKSYLADMLKVASQLKKNNVCQRADIFIEDGFFSVELARDYITQLHNLGFAVSIHADQLTRQGATALGIELNVQSVDHAIQLSNDDIQRLCDSETTAVLLPSADFYMKCAYPKARQLIDGGARVALATDFNPGTSPTQDLALVGLLARTEMKMNLHEVFCAYTVGAAHALGVHNEYGSIEEGKTASLFLSAAEPSDFFYSVGFQPVHKVMVRGKWSKSIE